MDTLVEMNERYPLDMLEVRGERYHTFIYTRRAWEHGRYGSVVQENTITPDNEDSGKRAEMLLQTGDWDSGLKVQRSLYSSQVRAKKK